MEDLSWFACWELSVELVILQISFTPNIILASSQLSVVCHEGFLNGSSLEQNSHAEFGGGIFDRNLT